MATGCKGCGNDLERSDRFCPVCGIPNPDTAFHPRFDPTWLAQNLFVEPAPEPEPVPRGTPQCPRCEQVVEPGDVHCRSCGMQLDTYWTRKGLGPGEVLPSRPGIHGAHWYRPVGSVAVVLQAVLTVGVLLCGATAVLAGWLYAQRSGALRQYLETDELTRLVDVGARLMAVMLAAGFVLLLLWSYRAYRNLSSLAVAGLRYRTWWTLVGWVVPVLNLIRPKQVLDDLYRASDPAAPPGSARWRTQPAPALTTGFWATLLLGGVFGVGVVAFNPGLDAAATADVQAVLVLLVLAGVCLGSAALTLQSLVRRTTGRQEHRAALLARYRELDERPVDGDGEVTEPVPLRAVADNHRAAGRY